MADGNLHTVSRLFAAVERRDLPALVELCAPDVEIREAPSLPYGGTYRGLEGIRAHAAGFVSTWERFQQAEHRRLNVELLGSGDVVIGLWRHRAAARAGAELDMPAISFARMRDGRVQQLQMFHFDTAALLRFLAVERT